MGLLPPSPTNRIIAVKVSDTTGAHRSSTACSIKNITLITLIRP
jgi:hypothetical protein